MSTEHSAAITRPSAVLLHRESADRLLAERGAAPQALPLQASSLDDDDVFHVTVGPATTQRVGVPVPCAVDVLACPPDDLAHTARRAEWMDRGGVHLGVAIWPGSDGPTGCADILRGNRVGPAALHFVPVGAGLGSRARGLLETRLLESRSVTIVGLGSGGSLIAVALAQAGIGRMVLFDHDRLEIHNIARHACGIGDLGRFKTLAMRDLLRGKNPSIEIETHEVDVIQESDLLDRAVAETDLLIAATDNDPSRLLLNQIALRWRKPALFGRALSRAAAGDVLRVRPHQGPCLACVFTKQYLESRPREFGAVAEAQAALPSYTSAENIQAVVQVGLASDIAPIANMIVKLALVELSRGRDSGIGSLDHDLTADFYTWANRREGAFAALSPMATSLDRMSILRWYGVEVSRRTECQACGSVGEPDDPFFL